MTVLAHRNAIKWVLGPSLEDKVHNFRVQANVPQTAWIRMVSVRTRQRYLCRDVGALDLLSTVYTENPMPLFWR